MSLRNAKFDDTWRRVFARTYANRLTRVSFQGLRCLCDSEMHFHGGVTAIIGANGVGKSTLLAAIADVLSNGQEVGDANYRIRLRGSRIVGTFENGDKRIEVEVKDGTSGSRDVLSSRFTGDYRWLDPSSLGTRYTNQIAADRNFSDLLEPVTPQYFNADEVAIASYLVGKAYDAVAVYEIVDYASFERFPYLRATSAGVTYGSEGMGKGELSLLLTYWTLRDLSRDSILVLEEPETHVSPKSQECLMNIVAKFSLEKGIWIIVTTHSPTITLRVPSQHIKLLARGTGDLADVQENISRADISLLLGGSVKQQGVFIVEDQAAKDFLTGILDEKAPELIKKYEVLSANSQSRISAILENMPSANDWLTLVGVYDGDMRNSVISSKFKWPHIFLPGTSGPEELLIACLKQTPETADLLAARLHKTPAQVAFSLDCTIGTDHHDFFTAMAKALAVHVSILRTACVRIWLSSGENAAAAEHMIRELETFINKS